MKVVIYKTNNNKVAVLSPSPTWTGTLEELAAKDVPAGSPWKIINASDLPSDRTFRDAWRWQD